MLSPHPPDAEKGIRLLNDNCRFFVEINLLALSACSRDRRQPWSRSQEVKTPPFQGGSAGFESRRDHCCIFRHMAQSDSAQGSGPCGPRFESGYVDSEYAGYIIAPLPGVEWAFDNASQRKTAMRYLFHNKSATGLQRFCCSS